MRYEVRTEGDGDYDYFIAPNDDFEHYNPERKDEAIAYARKVAGFVVQVEETEIFNAASTKET